MKLDRFKMKLYNVNRFNVNLNGGDKRKLDREKYMIARARACMGQKDLEAAGIPKGTLCRALRSEVRPETIGKIARALECDVSDIIDTEYN